MVISWPRGMRARGEVRHQYHHAIDVVPTILEVCGVEMPQYVPGYEQTPLPGVSMRYSFDDTDAPTAKVTQYYEMLGTRGLWYQGWKVVAEHGPMPSNIGHLDQDRWQLFHTDEDRAEANDLADQRPEKVQELVELWFNEAGKYNVLPLNDLSQLEYIKYEFQAPVPPSGTYNTYFPDTLEVPERSAANTHGVSYKLLTEVELAGPETQGVIFAHGSRFGGHALFVKDNKLWYVYNFLGIPPEQQFVAEGLTPGRHVLGVEFEKERQGEHGESHGTTRVYVDDQVVAEGPMRTQTGHFSLCGEGLCIGRDGGDTVTRGRRLRHYQRARPPHLVAALTTWALVVPQAIAHAHPGPACWATRCSAARGG